MRKKLIANLIIMVMALGCMAPTIVGADTYTKSGFACKKGNNIYFAFTSTKKSTPIYKYNVQTRRRTKVFPRRGNSIKEFKNLNIMGKYLYCAARPAKSLSCRYIYKVNVKKGTAKKLAKGTNPTIVDGRIVFEAMKPQRINDNLSMTYVPSGKDYSSDLNCKKKKPVNHTAINAETKTRGDKIAYGKYKFYITSDGKNIYRQNGKSIKQICKAKKITGFRVLSGYLIVKTTKNGRNYAYCVKNNGSSSVRILTW